MYKSLIEKDETILWRKNDLAFQYCLNHFLRGLALLIIIFIIGYYSVELAFFMGFILWVVIVIYLHSIKGELYSEYIITNQKIIVNDNFHQNKIILFREIDHVEIENKNIFLRLKETPIQDTITLYQVKNPQEVRNYITRGIENLGRTIILVDDKESEIQQINLLRKNEILSQIASPYQLQFNSSLSSENKHIYFHKREDELKTNILIKEILNKIRIEINIDCPNFKNHYFRIKRENILSPISKSLGQEDLITGHEKFDDLYLIQSSDIIFFKSIFNLEIIHQLTEEKKLSGIIIFGEYQKTNHSISKNTEDILDIELIQGKDAIRGMDKEKNSTLTYYIEFKNQRDIIDELTFCFQQYDLLLLITQQIKKYYS